MSPDTKALYEMLQTKMHAAFKLVEPKTYWKDPICAVVTARGLGKAGVTIEEVAESVAHFTGTPAFVRQLGDGVYEVKAAGYLAGPCN